MNNTLIEFGNQFLAVARGLKKDPREKLLGGALMDDSSPLLGGTIIPRLSAGEKIHAVEPPKEEEANRIKCIYCGNWGEEKTQCTCGAPLDPIAEEKQKKETGEEQMRRLGL